MTVTQWVFIVLVAVLGHVMSLFWYTALHRGWRICERTIYALPIDRRQVAREVRNSVHTPIHAVLLLVCLATGFFDGGEWSSLIITLAATAVWAEIWHYFSHRAMHLRSLHWIHAEHHRSRLNSPFTAISFSFTEKMVFDIGMLLPFLIADLILPVHFVGIALWYVGYLVINSFAHANFEFRAPGFNNHVGAVLTTTTYHSLHHSRYTGNYGLGTRVLDRLFGTEWPDYEQVYAQVTDRREPLTNLRERVGSD